MFMFIGSFSSFLPSLPLSLFLSFLFFFFLSRNRRIFLRNYSLIVVSCQSRSKPKGVLKTAFWKERTDCSHRVFSQSRLLKAVHRPSGAAAPPASQGLGARNTYISHQLPWVPACPGAVWWQLMSAAPASVPREPPIPSAANTGQWNHQHELTHVNQDTAMPQSRIRKLSTKDSLQSALTVECDQEESRGRGETF